MNIDINLTSICNFGCRYCSEGQNPEMPNLARIENSKTRVPLQAFINFIDGLSDKNVDIGFWGGEPFINFDYAYKVMNNYIQDSSKTFMFYTNGAYVEKYITELVKINNELIKYPNPNKERLFVQVSYDGAKVNDVERVTKSGKSTSDIAKNALRLLQKNGIVTSFKSTVSPRTFKYLFDAFKEIVEEFGAQHYFPTPDSFSDYPEECYTDLFESLMKIAKYIHDNKLKPETFKWFTNSKAICSAGQGYYAIDLDGEITPCHSTMYEAFSDHRIGNILDIDIYKKLENANKKYHDLSLHMHDLCGDCDVKYCMRCPAGCYHLESICKNACNHDDQYAYKWTTPNPNMCKVFKISNIVYDSLVKVCHLS